MRQTLTLSAIVLTAFATLALAGTAAMRDAGDRSLKQRQELNASIDRMLAERLARRDEPEFFAPEGAGKGEEGVPVDVETAAVAAASAAAISAAATDGVTPRPRKRPAELGESASAPHQAREAKARMRAKRRVTRIPLIRPERLIPDTFRTIRRFTFGLVR